MAPWFRKAALYDRAALEKNRKSALAAATQCPLTGKLKKSGSFNHFIGPYQKALRYGHAKRLCRLEIDYQLEFCRLLYW
jgi:hypothetical protein